MLLLSALPVPFDKALWERGWCLRCGPCGGWYVGRLDAKQPIKPIKYIDGPPGSILGIGSVIAFLD